MGNYLINAAVTGQVSMTPRKSGSRTSTVISNPVLDSFWIVDITGHHLPLAAAEAVRSPNRS
jgi:hypothetical protein